MKAKLHYKVTNGQQKSQRTLTYHNFFLGLFLFVLMFLVFMLAVSIYYSHSYSKPVYAALEINRIDKINTVTLRADLKVASPRDINCTYWDCFNVYKCGKQTHGHISVYIYPLVNYFDEKGKQISRLSKEFYSILKTIRHSRFYTENPDEACLFIPSIDTLNQNRLSLEYVSRAFEQLSHWNDGENHLIFNMLPGSSPNYNRVIDINTGKALIAGAGFDTWTFRSTFDISIPIYSPEAKTIDSTQPVSKKYFIISSQINLFPDYVTDLKYLASANEELLLLEDCSSDQSMTNYSIRCQYRSSKIYHYPNILKHGMFCLIMRTVRLAQSALMDALASGCVPIIIADSVVMPFHPYIDWHKIALFIPEENLSSLIEVAQSVSTVRLGDMLKQTRWVYDRYFSSIEKITMTTLNIINERAFPLMAQNYEDWNMAEHLYGVQNPLFLPVTSPKSIGFTAVILTYDRVDSLFTLVRKLSRTPSLVKILVIWNNQKKHPPPANEWPSVSKPIKVIRTNENLLSNRFYPYDEIETECQLTIDDDIIMLTSDELEFGFDVWREFPDRIVGFPSRLHTWDNVTQGWKYQSEWTNEISMVLTGAAFHHKIWSWYYTYKMPGEIKQWVDTNFNCEDIAINFLVANITNKAPIKVVPRKKFKCPECTNNEMLSADLSHMTQRSACINYFTKIFGRMALKTVEFRADPVLYMDNFPEKLKLYNDVGSL